MNGASNWYVLKCTERGQEIRFLPPNTFYSRTPFLRLRKCAGPRRFWAFSLVYNPQSPTVSHGEHLGDRGEDLEGERSPGGTVCGERWTRGGGAEGSPRKSLEKLPLSLCPSCSGAAPQTPPGGWSSGLGQAPRKPLTSPRQPPLSLAADTITPRGASRTSTGTGRGKKRVSGRGGRNSPAPFPSAHPSFSSFQIKSNAMRTGVAVLSVLGLRPLRSLSRMPGVRRGTRSAKAGRCGQLTPGGAAAEQTELFPGRRQHGGE